MKKQTTDQSISYDKIDSEIYTSPPVVNISLWSEKFQKWIDTKTIIDSGAMLSFFPFAFIKKLGISEKNCLMRLIAKSNGTQVFYIYKNQKIRLGKLESTVPIGFDKDISNPFLGGKAVFQLINISPKDLPEGISKDEIYEMKSLIAHNIPDINEKLGQLINRLSVQKPKEMEVKKLEYEIYTDKEIIHNVGTEKIQELRNRKNDFDLFVEWNRQEIYVKNRHGPVNNLKKSPKQWVLLADLLEHKGVSGTNEEIYCRIYLGRTRAIAEKRAMEQLKYRLNQFFKTHKLSMPRTELNIYKLPKNLKFCMIKEKIRRK